MSGGIARGRLTEERKAWRKNHPHVKAYAYDASEISGMKLCAAVSGYCGVQEKSPPASKAISSSCLDAIHGFLVSCRLTSQGTLHDSLSPRFLFC
ncbi:hypothetical protein Ccrd_005459 [Cynara cardunculus var. scolymus]|uniref:Uncharacterized protein n=1 Tax=Cynara cardunculus var. scolymus TaxID=59895 RepID=A0A103XKZ8_CYNCS|nr:hypothetical protein Ccrd_005459 [Cynara cardunculus var. scolymus]